MSRAAMRRTLYKGGICLITDRNMCRLTPAEMALTALRAGIRWIQYREKNADRRVFLANALQIREITRHYKACFIVNDFPDIAAIVDADGVHLGQDDLPVMEARIIVGKSRIIGVSTHSLKEAMAACEDGADYIGFGPVYATKTKDAGKPKGTEMLKKVVKKVNVPVVAIGGIGLGKLRDVIATGAGAVAAASAILKGDMDRNARRYYENISKLA